MQPSIGILLREVARLYTQAQRENVTSGHDTSSTQNHVLMELGRAGLLTQHELGRRLSLDKGWVSRAVESLVQSGLVAKSRRDNDRRSRWLQLTGKGTTRYKALSASLDAHAEQLMQPLADEQRESIYQALQLLLNGLQNSLPQESAGDALPAPQASATITPRAEQTAEQEPAMVEAAATAEAAHEVGHTPALEASAAEIAEQAISDAKSSTPTETPEVVNKAPAAQPVVRVKPVGATTRLGQPDAPTRIVGSRTLPTRPLLSSRTTPRTPLSRAAHQAELKNPASGTDNTPTPKSPLSTAPHAPAHEPQHVTSRPVAPATPVLRQPPVSPSAPQHVSAGNPLGATAKPQQPAPAIRHVIVTPVKPAAAPVAAQPSPQQNENRAQGSLLHKLISSQGSLFNKLLQREQVQEEAPEEEVAPVEVDPKDGIQFQSAFPTDWNEIRNLLTANRLPVQGALNHLSNFVVATENGRVVGAIGLEVYGDIGLLRSLVVASHMRGKSIAKRLIKHMIAQSRSRQLSALYLITGSADPLFERYGFEKMARADMPTKLYVSMELQGPSSTASTGMRLIL